MTNRGKAQTWFLAASLVAMSATKTVRAAAESDLWTALRSAAQRPLLEIQHPIDGAVFPANFPSPVLLWKTNAGAAQPFAAGFIAGQRQWLFTGIQPMWRPPEEDWRQIKQAGRQGTIVVVVAGLGGEGGREVVSRGSVSFTVSERSVEYPLFYREVNLPFSEAVKDPSKIRWRFGGLGQGTLPPVVLENLPVCGNCHSFDQKGRYLAMDVDYANSKASYIITPTAPEMKLATSDIITWDDYRREDGQQTFGLLSQISPDARYVLSTVKDRSVFVPKPDLAFSQLFFPLKGILALYDRQTKQFAALPGADDPEFVQSNPTWSPDGQWIVFTRNKAAELEKSRNNGTILLSSEECEEFLKRGKAFQYDLYRLPFNVGKGGKAQPIAGASGNGRSNYFPKYSPDGRWIVFCQASNYMLLQPDSELYIIPAQGGQARRLGCNLSRMNSWHSWTPDGNWLVFSSKEHSDYTQLYLARISPQGEASPPVWLAHMVAAGRAANIPEFVDLPVDGIVRIREQFLDDYSFTRAGNQFFLAGEADQAMAKYRQALELNPKNTMAHQKLGFLLHRVKNQPEEGLQHTRAAVALDPQNGFAQFDLGTALADQGDLSNGVVHLAEAIRLLPNGYDRQYNAVDMHLMLGLTTYRLGDYARSISALERVLAMAADHPRANYLMALAMASLGETETATPYNEKAVQRDPELARLPDFYDRLSGNYVKQGLYAKGLTAAEKARRLATEAGRGREAAQLQQRAELCRKMMTKAGGN